MSALLIRKIDAALKARLRMRAAKNGRSMEEEARSILRRSLEGADAAETVGAGTLAVSLFGKKHGVDLDIDPRQSEGEPPDFSR